MGLNTASSTGPVVAPAPKGILDPSTGKPVGANDPFFLEVNSELSEKGFYALGYTMALFSVIAVQKNVRDLAAAGPAPSTTPPPADNDPQATVWR